VYADIQEIFSSQFELPELGPLGSHGLANPRDFESPVASFDVDQSPWKSKCWSLTKQYCFSDVVSSYVVIYKYVATNECTRGAANWGCADLEDSCSLASRTIRRSTLSHGTESSLLHSHLRLPLLTRVNPPKLRAV
jgi:hypothetical protein